MEVLLESFKKNTSFQIKSNQVQCEIFFIERPLNKTKIKKMFKFQNKWLQRLVRHGFPGCFETKPTNREIAMEDHSHVVPWANDWEGTEGPAILLFNRTEGDENIVIGTVIGRVFDIKTFEGELDSLSWGDL